MSTRHPQDDLLLVDALVNYAYLFEEGDPGRADRALALADEFAARYDRGDPPDRRQALSVGSV